MHDRLDQQRMNEDVALAAALRALPATAPPREGWQRLAVRIAHEKRRRTMLRVALPAALAAGIALAVWLPQAQRARPLVPAVAQRGATQAAPIADVAALRAHSQRLQDWVRTLDRNGAPLDDVALADAVAMQDRIGLIDLQLSATSDPAASAALWQQRNAMLEQLGLLRLRPYAVAMQAHATRADTTIL